MYKLSGRHIKTLDKQEQKLPVVEPIQIRLLLATYAYEMKLCSVLPPGLACPYSFVFLRCWLCTSACVECTWYCV